MPSLLRQVLGSPLVIVSLCIPGLAQDGADSVIPDDPDKLMEFLNSDASPMRRAPELFGEGNYLAPIQYLESIDVAGTMLEDPCGQILGTWRAMVSDHQAAEGAFGSHGYAGTAQSRISDRKALLGDYARKPALAEVVRRSAGHSFVIVNEAHHVPQTRMLTVGLLQPLWDQGFRYLALEAIDPGMVESFTAAGRAVQGKGGYLSEPVFADLVGHALEIGYTLVAYEADSMDHSSPMAGLNDREDQQARHLLEVLDADPEARVLVHCGYAHLDEKTDDGWTHMAERLHQIAEIDPLTVDQTAMRGYYDHALEHPVYDAVAGSLELPTVYLNGGGDSWVPSEARGKHDIVVFLPRPDPRALRPGWLRWFGRRRPVTVAGPATAVEASDGPFLLQAFAKEKGAGPLHEQVPVDQCMLREGAASCQLYLPPGTYTTRAVNPAGKALPGWSQTLAVE